MALNGDVLGDLMIAAMDAAFLGLSDVQRRDHDLVRHLSMRALGNAIVTHILTAQVVVTSVSGVMTGGGASGPGTGSLL
jgi:hypothetical protein